MSKCAIVTGGFGFIGSALCRRLCDMGWEVIIFENMEGGKVRQVACAKDAVVEIRNIDVTKLDGLTEDFAHVDWFFHFAAHYANEKSLEYPITSISHNVVGTMAALKFCLRNDIGNFCYASSSGVYGGIQNLVYEKDMLPQPNTPYEVGKYSGELLSLGWGDIYDMNIVCPRFWNVYGIGDVPGRWRSVIPNFFTLASEGKDLLVTGKEASRDFTYIEDCIKGILAGVSYATNSKSRTQLVYNICNGKEVSIYGLAQKIISLCGSRSDIVVAPKRKWDNALRRVGSPKRFNSLFPGIVGLMRGIDDGLALSKDWYTDSIERIA